MQEMQYTLQDALIPTALQLPAIFILSALGLVIAMYFTIHSENVRNYWLGNRGQATLLFLVVISIFGQGIEIPALIYAGINIVVTLVMLPLVVSGLVTTVAFGAKKRR